MASTRRYKMKVRAIPGFREFGEDIRWLGNGPGLAALTGGFALAGWVFDRPKERETARLLIEASLSGVVFTTAGKYLLFGRSRPEEGSSAQTGFRSFQWRICRCPRAKRPALSSWRVSSPRNTHQWYVQLISYSLAGAVGAGRIALDAHWTSDVFISAALGIAVSKAVVYFNRKRQEKRKKLKAAGSSRRVYRKHYFSVSPRSFRWTIVF